MRLANRITLRLPEEIQKKYSDIAQKTGNTLSEVVRNSLLKTQPKFHDQLAAKDRLEVIRLISKSSNNLNQIAHHLNTLALVNQLHYSEAIHYLRLLETIELQQHSFLKLFPC